MVRLFRLWLVRRRIRRNERELACFTGVPPDDARAADVQELIPLVAQELEQLRRREAELAGRSGS